MNLLFLVPARGGSKRFPRKNLAELGGIPLVGRAVRLASRAAAMLPDSARIICSTDNESIAATAREWGAEVPFLRPAELASDQASSLDVVRHALDALQINFDAVVLLQATSPLTEPDDVVAAVEAFRQTGDPTISVCEADHPIEWYVRADENGHLVRVLPRDDARPDKKLAPASRPNGAIYVASPSQLRAEGFFTPSTRAALMPRERSIDVDTQWDFDIASRILEARTAPKVVLGRRPLDPSGPCLVVASPTFEDLSDATRAERWVAEAHEAGAEAISLPAPEQLRDWGGDARSSLASQVRSLDLVVIAEVTEPSHPELLASLRPEAYEVAPDALQHRAFCEALIESGRPIMLQAGRHHVTDLDRALGRLRNRPPALLLLTSVAESHAAASPMVRLRQLRAAYPAPVGLTDASACSQAIPLGLALGAALIKQGLRVRTGPNGDDAPFLEPPAFRRFVSDIRTAESLLGRCGPGARAGIPQVSSSCSAGQPW